MKQAKRIQTDPQATQINERFHLLSSQHQKSEIGANPTKFSPDDRRRGTYFALFLQPLEGLGKAEGGSDAESSHWWEGSRSSGELGRG